MKEITSIMSIVFNLTLILCISCRYENKSLVKEGVAMSVNHITEIGSDSIFIPFGGIDDSLAYSHEEVKNILKCYPELNDNDVFHPDFTYMKSRTRRSCFDSISKSDCDGFSSELGRDEYYTLYGYFLRKRFNSEAKFQQSRQKITEIYLILNELFGKLKHGGTYFGHQHRRITGYAEYSIYRLNKYENELVKQYDISKQKQLFINLLHQIIEDEVLIDNGTPDKKEKSKRIQQLFKLTDRLKILITDSFYLNEAIEFQYSSY